MAILWKINRTGDVHRDIWIQFCGLLRVENLSRNSEFSRFASGFCFFIESMLRSAKHQEPFFDEPEIEPRNIGEFLECSPAGEMHIAKKRRGTGNMFGRGSSPEFEGPTEKIEIDSRLDPERRFRVPHPFQTERDCARRGKRNKMAGHDHAGITEG